MILRQSVRKLLRLVRSQHRGGRGLAPRNLIDGDRFPYERGVILSQVSDQSHEPFHFVRGQEFDLSSGIAAGWKLGP